MLINRKSPHGGDIYTYSSVRLDLSANINPLGMPDAVKKALYAAVEDCQAYPDPYCTELRRRLAVHERISADHFLCGNGAAELIYAYDFALPKDKPALIVSPTFCEYGQALAAAGIMSEHYILKEADGFRLTDELLQTDLGQYSAVFLSSPNNPTGITVKSEIIRGILDTGVRLGYAISSDTEFLAKMSEKTQCRNVSILAQAAGIAALGCGDWLEGSVRQISAERKRLSEKLCALGIRVYSGEANYLLLYSERDLAKKLMERGITVRSCANYIGLGDGYIGIAVRTREENDILLTELKEVLK